MSSSFNEILLGVSAQVWNVDDRHAAAAGKGWAKCEVDIEFAQWQEEKSTQLVSPAGSILIDAHHQPRKDIDDI